MVSFSCEACGDILIKRKLDSHKNQCAGASFTCLDCMINFEKTDYRAHSSCVSEAQKYQGALYRPEKEKKQNQSNPTTSPSNFKNEKPSDQQLRNHRTNSISNSEKSFKQNPRTPRSQSLNGDKRSAPPVNVFDFLVDSQTPNISTTNLPSCDSLKTTKGIHTPTEKRAEHDPSNNSIRGTKFSSKARDHISQTTKRSELRKEKRDRADESDFKECKRLHIESKELILRDSDDSMTDAPPIICHTGLTGDVNRVMSRPEIFPPSPDYSGGDGRNPSPRSPLKKAKPVKKRAPNPRMSNSLRYFIAGRPIPHQSEEPNKIKLKKKDSSPGNRKPKITHSKPLIGEAKSKESTNNDVVVYQPMLSPVELLLSFINKGPDSSRGVSMNKALKKYHRERQELGIKTNKAGEEKELWRSLRLKRNDRGEIVLFIEE